MLKTSKATKKKSEKCMCNLLRVALLAFGEF